MNGNRLSILIGLVFIILGALLINRWIEHGPPPEPQTYSLRTIKQQQQFLKDANCYDGEIDGLLGPLMQAGWNQYSNNEDAKIYFTLSGAKK